MPTTQTSEDMLETAIGRLMRGEPGMRLRSIAMRPDCRLDVADLWAFVAYQSASAGIGDRPDHRHRESSSGFLTRSSNPPSIAWSAAVTRNETSTGFGSPRPVREKSTSSRRYCRAGSSTSSPAHRISRADRTGLKSRLRSTGSLTGSSRNRTGTSHPSSLPRNFLSGFHDELPAHRFAVRRVFGAIAFLPLAARWAGGTCRPRQPGSTSSPRRSTEHCGERLDQGTSSAEIRRADEPEPSKPSMTGSSRPPRPVGAN